MACEVVVGERASSGSLVPGWTPRLRAKREAVWKRSL